MLQFVVLDCESFVPLLSRQFSRFRTILDKHDFIHIVTHIVISVPGDLDCNIDGGEEIKGFKFC